MHHLFFCTTQYSTPIGDCLLIPSPILNAPQKSLALTWTTLLGGWGPGLLVYLITSSVRNEDLHLREYLNEGHLSHKSTRHPPTRCFSWVVNRHIDDSPWIRWCGTLKLHGGFHKGGYPQIIHCFFLIGIFPYKPSSYWGFPICGNPHMYKWLIIPFY